MKLKINKACDLNSISVLPPHTRRSSLAPNGQQSSQLRSQPSQQSFSQGISSQHALFSQISQTSHDEVLTTDQRFGSQERESTAKKFSCLPPTNLTREDSQMQISRSSTNLIRKWNSGSASEHRCQNSEELEHRLSVIETSLNRFLMILDSVQSDVMQVNRGTKEVLLESLQFQDIETKEKIEAPSSLILTLEGIRQKLIAEDTSLHLMNKGLEDIKASLDGGMKAISDQLNKDIYRDKLQQIFLVLATLPEQMEASLLKLQNELCNNFTKEIKAIACNVKSLDQKPAVSSTILQPKSTGHCATLQTKPQAVKKQVVPPQFSEQPALAPKVETGGWKSVKTKQSTIHERASCKENKRKGVSSVEQEKYRILIESDEDMDGGFSCLLDGKEKDDTTKIFIEDAKEETQRILRKARRQKRKYQNPIIIN